MAKNIGTDKISIELYDENGNIKKLNDEESENLLKPTITSNLRLLFRKVSENLSFPLLFSLFKSGMKRILGPLPDKDRYELYSYLFNLKGKNAKISFRECEFKFHGFGLLPLFFTTIIRHNQYNLSKKNVKNKIVIDAGANAGFFSIYAAKLGAKKVYAFEPVTETYEILKRNISLNKLENVIIPIIDN